MKIFYQKPQTSSWSGDIEDVSAYDIDSPWTTLNWESLTWASDCYSSESWSLGMEFSRFSASSKKKAFNK